MESESPTCPTQHDACSSPCKTDTVAVPQPTTQQAHRTAKEHSTANQSLAHFCLACLIRRFTNAQLAKRVSQCAESRPELRAPSAREHYNIAINMVPSRVETTTHICACCFGRELLKDHMALGCMTTPGITIH